MNLLKNILFIPNLNFLIFIELNNGELRNLTLTYRGLNSALNNPEFKELYLKWYLGYEFPSLSEYYIGILDIAGKFQKFKKFKNNKKDLILVNCEIQEDKQLKPSFYYRMISHKNYPILKEEGILECIFYFNNKPIKISISFNNIFISNQSLNKTIHYEADIKFDNYIIYSISDIISEPPIENYPKIFENYADGDDFKFQLILKLDIIILECLDLDDYNFKIISRILNLLK